MYTYILLFGIRVLKRVGTTHCVRVGVVLVFVCFGFETLSSCSSVCVYWLLGPVCGGLSEIGNNAQDLSL